MQKIFVVVLYLKYYTFKFIKIYLFINIYLFNLQKRYIKGIITLC